MTKYFHVRETISFTSSRGVPRVLAKDEPVSSNDPDFKFLQKRNFLEPMEKWLAARGVGVEDASAEPGSHRSVSTVSRGESRKEPEKPAAAKTAADKPADQAAGQGDSPKGDKK